jgi:hypothetical protein
VGAQPSNTGLPADGHVAHLSFSASLILLAMALSPSTTVAGKRYVTTPDVSWDEIQPYLRSHVVPWLHDSDFQVYVCTGQVLRDVVTDYDDELGSFAKVLGIPRPR